MIAWASLLLSKNLVYKNYDSLAGFLLQGDWMRGLNPFSFTSILMVIAYAYLINLAHVRMVSSEGLVIGNETLPVSKHRKKECLQRIAAFRGALL